MSSTISGLTLAPEQPSALPFLSAADHLLACVELLKQRLHLEVLRLRARGLLVENDFRGLYIADEQIDAILSDSSESSTPQQAEISADIRLLERQLAARVKVSEEEGIWLPMTRLSHLFGLDVEEQQVLVACVAPEVDLRIEALYSYVQNDVNRKRPTTDLLLKLVDGNRSERIGRRILFASDGRLIANRLITCIDDPAQKENSILAQAWRSDERITNYLLDGQGVDSRLQTFTEMARPSKHRPLLLPPELVRELTVALPARGGTALVLRGASGSGKRSVAEALSATQGRSLLVADLARAMASHIALPELLRLLIREAVLQQANLFLANGDVLVPEKGQPYATHLASVEKDFELFRRTIIIGTRSPDIQFRLNIPTHVFDLPLPAFPYRLQFWETAIARSEVPTACIDAAGLANKFMLSGGQIQAACGSAAAAVRLRAPQHPLLTVADLEAAARLQSNQGLRKLAQKITTCLSWRDLVLPPRAMQQLRAAAAAYKLRHVVYSQWGFDKRLAMGKGLNILFWGSSGTGKTLAASVLANELGLELYKIDLSSVVSKYIGETEKQLSVLFREAETSNAILFFDEADALFGKRSEVKDAHDRYANVETSYLLQKMEEYAGIVILTTNFRKNIDDAFARRMHHVVEFSAPDAALRLQIWKTLIPQEAHLSADVDLEFLARQFNLTGGHIRNIALAAAFLAANEGEEIRMAHLILATARELHKEGKLPSRPDFKHYFDSLHGQV